LSVEVERADLEKQRKALAEKLDLIDGELADQFEAVAKQTKRLTERRADLEARSAEVEKEIETRIRRATEDLSTELAAAKTKYEQRVKALETQVQAAEKGSEQWRVRETELEGKLALAASEAAKLQTELKKVGAELDEASCGRLEQAEILAEQVMRFEKESADWQRKLERAVAEAPRGDNEGLKEAAAAAEAARAEVERLTARLEEMGAVREDLENRLGVQTARGAELERIAEGLKGKLSGAERDVREWKEKYDGAMRRAVIAMSGPTIPTPAKAVTPPPPPTAPVNKEAEEKLKAELSELTKQVAMHEAQREDLLEQLSEVQEAMRRQAQENLQKRNGMENELRALLQRCGEMEAKVKEREAARSRLAQVAEGLGGARSMAERERLFKKAKLLREHRKNFLEMKEKLDKSSEDVAKQREQLRSRKENLEQVKRLLEKQEMVMARKLADHNALKTVAAVGIFLILILGSVFFGVYKFVSPVYRSEALVQLSPPAGMQGAELQAWLSRQMEFLRTPEVTFAAWKVLRAEGERYGMHDVREEWVGSLKDSLSMELEEGTRTMSIRYTGHQAEGVAQVCNALATAYVMPVSREGADPKGMGEGAVILAKATPSNVPMHDNRMMMSLSLVAVALFVSLLLVIVFRHYVSRQLREIDQMADDGDLAGLKGEMA
jgi:hypothetical protein